MDDRLVTVLALGVLDRCRCRPGAAPTCAVTRELLLRATQLKLVAVPDQLRRLGSRALLSRGQRRPQRLDPGQADLALDGVVILESQPEQERPEGQPLEHERA